MPKLKQHSVVQKSYQCQFCKVKCRRPQDLRRHLLVHAEASFECDLCGNKFTRFDTLRRHKRDNCRNSQLVYQTRLSARQAQEAAEKARSRMEQAMFAPRFINIYHNPNSESNGPPQPVKVPFYSPSIYYPSQTPPLSHPSILPQQQHYPQPPPIPSPPSHLQPLHQNSPHSFPSPNDGYCAPAALSHMVPIPPQEYHPIPDHGYYGERIMSPAQNGYPPIGDGVLSHSMSPQPSGLIPVGQQPLISPYSQILPFQDPTAHGAMPSINSILNMSVPQRQSVEPEQPIANQSTQSKRLGLEPIEPKAEIISDNQNSFRFYEYRK